MLRHFTSFDVMHVMSTGTKGIIGSIFGKVELTNTFWPMIILSLGGIAFKNGLYIYMMRQFFKGVPDELEESAYVDGSGTFRTYVQIILPLSVPMMITIFLFAFSWQWTDQFYSGIFFTGSSRPWVMPDIVMMPASLEILYARHPVYTLYQNVVNSTAGIMIIAPLVVMYLFCQKYLVQGIERSGLVG
jgi:multiple sugar transport system permease protein